jgi:hypothetical protein
MRCTVPEQEEQRLRGLFPQQLMSRMGCCLLNSAPHTVLVCMDCCTEDLKDRTTNNSTNGRLKVRDLSITVSKKSIRINHLIRVPQELSPGFPWQDEEMGGKELTG